MKQTNYLQGVFWDYPQFIIESAVEQTLEQSRREEDTPLYRWMMVRFLEYGRAIDTLRYFSIEDIDNHLADLLIRPETRKKWQRLIEVYGAD